MKWLWGIYAVQKGDFKAESRGYCPQYIATKLCGSQFLVSHPFSHLSWNVLQRYRNQNC